MNKDSYIRMAWNEACPDIFMLIGWVVAICVPPALIPLYKA